MLIKNALTRAVVFIEENPKYVILCDPTNEEKFLLI